VTGSIEDIGPFISQSKGVEEEASKPGFTIRLGGPGAHGSNNTEERPKMTKVKTTVFFILLAFQ
jgi:hypothetical protein